MERIMRSETWNSGLHIPLALIKSLNPHGPSFPHPWNKDLDEHNFQFKFYEVWDQVILKNNFQIMPTR